MARAVFSSACPFQSALRLALLVFCLGAMLFRPSAAETPAGDKGPGGDKGLSFGLVSVMSQDVTADIWRPLLAALSQRLGVPVASHTAQDYAGIVWALANGHDQLAWLGNKSAIEAVDNAGAEV